MQQRLEEGGAAGERDSILIVDDTSANLLAFSAILKKLSCRIVTAASGREALTCALDQDFRVILMDVRMPDMNGFETAEAIRKRSRSRETPILFLSAFETPPLHILGSFVGGSIDFLSSPVDAGVLVDKVAGYLRPGTAEPASDPKLLKAGSDAGAGNDARDPG